MANNFSGGLFWKTNVCCQMGAVKKEGYLPRVWSLTRVQLGVQLSFFFHFCDNQTPLVHTISFYLMRAFFPSILMLTGSGVFGPPLPFPSLAVFLHKPNHKWKPIPPPFVHIWQSGFHLPLSNSVHFFSEIKSIKMWQLEYQFAKSHFTAIFTTWLPSLVSSTSFVHGAKVN